jgi:hypothetical protein
MNKSTLTVFVQLLFFTAILLALNFLVYQMPDLKNAMDDFIYPLPVTYALFYILSVIVIGVLVIVSKKNKEQIGYAFLFLTGAKMAVSYVFARAIINKVGGNPTEKINFFVIFILFLAIEAYYTARLLNNKQ